MSTTKGLAETLRLYLDDLSDGGQTRYQLDDRLSSEPGADVRIVVLRIAQEAVANVRRHASARSASVHLEERDGGFLVRITDDGVGFVVDGRESASGQLGLATMRWAAERAGGWIRIESDGQTGTTVSCWIPNDGPVEPWK